MGQNPPAAVVYAARSTLLAVNVEATVDTRRDSHSMLVTLLIGFPQLAHRVPESQHLVVGRLYVCCFFSLCEPR